MLVRFHRLLRTHLIVCLLALAGAAFAVINHVLLFPHLSGDLDEATYLLQARALASGHLTLSAAQHDAFYRPWLTGEHDGRLFTKYLPGLPGILAVPIRLFGTATPALAVTAAAWLLAVYAFALELFDNRLLAIFSALLTGLSPLFFVQSSLFLSYVASTAVLLGAAAFLLRGMRLQQASSMVLAGFLFGCGVLLRQFDVLLVGLPVGVFLVIRYRHRPARVLRGFACALAGAVVPLVVVLAYDASVTGGPLRLPLTAVDPLDKFGFGKRRIMPGEPLVTYSHRLAWRSLSGSLQTVPSWVAGGFLLLGLALLGLVLAARRLEAALLLALCLIFPAAYFFFWGTLLSANSALNGIGPHYYLTAFAPLTILAAVGLDRLAALRQRIAVPVLVLLVVIAVPLTWNALGPKIAVQQYVNGIRRDTLAALPPRDQLHRPAVVLLESPDGRPSSVGNMYGSLINDPFLHSDLLWAAGQGAGDWRLPELASGRTIYALRPNELVHAETPFGPRGSITTLSTVVGARLSISLTAVAPPRSRCLSAYLNLPARSLTVPITCDAVAGRTYRYTFVLGGPGVALPPVGTSSPVVVGLAVTSHSKGAEERWEYRDGLGVESGPAGPEGHLLHPGPTYRLIAFTNGRYWLQARLAPTLQVDVRPGG